MQSPINNNLNSTDTSSYATYRKNIEDFEFKIKNQETLSSSEIEIIESAKNSSAIETLTGFNKKMFSAILPKPLNLKIPSHSNPLSKSKLFENLISQIASTASNSSAFMKEDEKVIKNLDTYAKKLYQKALEVEYIKAKIIGNVSP